MKKTTPLHLRSKRISSSRSRKRPAPARRPNQPPPQIYVKQERPERGWWYHRAHLRNKGGYVYLCWREGKNVRTFYLGKAPRKSPTRDPAADAGARSSAPDPRRAKT